jgi:methionyl-tRNA synthetase
VHERPLDRVSEESYFFRLSDYSEFLLETIAAQPDLIRPEARRNEVVSFIKQGLQDLSISRERTSVSWGIPVPDDEKHVMYVWLDALSNYITALGYGNKREGAAGFDKYWQNVVHLVGKDILRFHAIYWPAFLFAAGVTLPKTVYAHGLWLDADGRKMSKTLGNVIDVNVLREHFQMDALRYFLLREMVFGQDGKFGYENLIDRVNADLAGGLGNLSSRTLSMVTKYRGGVIPSGEMNAVSKTLADAAGLAPDEGGLIAVLTGLRDEYLKRFERFEFNQALEAAWAVIDAVDKMISDSKPWVLAKDEANAEVLNAVLYRSLESLRWLCVLLYPMMPEATRNIYAQLGFDGDVAAIDPASLEWGGTAAGTKIGETSGVFPRIDKNKVMNEIENSGQDSVVSQTESKATLLPNDGLPKAGVAGAAGGEASDSADKQAEESFITIDDFLKVDLRVGVVQVCERIPNADKLLRFEIDLGEEKPRQILAGLAEYYEPEKMIGRKVVVVANLKPRKMRGLESQGMICAASLEDGTGPKPAVATFLEDVEIGARLK